MFEVGDIIGRRYQVDGVCSAEGGMGVLLFVIPLQDVPEYRLVLKYCRDNEDEQIKRFRREVRLLASFQGNSKIVQLWDHNLDHDPPYYVMKYYPKGDVLHNAEQFRGDLVKQEAVILQMIDCIDELHSRNEYHRDIKPQNFLVEGNEVVVSDFGLSTEVGSNTAFTRSSAFWGTHGYIPPEFLQGGFKHADASGDIFMLGKTIYVLLTNREPMYLVENDIPPPLFHVIERCCMIEKTQRYQNLADIKQSIVAAFDVILERGGGIGKVKQLLSAINDKIEQERKYSSDDVAAFVEQLALLEESDQVRVCFELQHQFFTVIRQELVAECLPTFLGIYEKLVENRGYSWSYAETIASNMKEIFTGDGVSSRNKVRTLELAILAADYMNRFAAMDTCRSMITSVRDENLGLEVAALLIKYKNTFIAGIEPSKCSSDRISNALRLIQMEQP